jgi:hypothetical protein
MGDAARPLAELDQRDQAPLNLAPAQQQHRDPRTQNGPAEEPGEAGQRAEDFVLRFAQHQGPGGRGEDLVQQHRQRRRHERAAGRVRRRQDSGGRLGRRLDDGIGARHQVGRCGAEQDPGRVVQHPDPGVGRGQVGGEASPEKLGADLADQRPGPLAHPIETAEHEGARGDRIGGDRHDQRQAGAQVLPVRWGKAGSHIHPAEHGDPLAVVPLELQGVEPAPGQQVDAGVEQAIRGPAGGVQLMHHAGRNALERRVEQEQPLVQRQAHGLVRLIESALALSPELAGDMAVGECRDEGDGQHRTAYEEQEEPSPEPALQWCGS